MVTELEWDREDAIAEVAQARRARDVAAAARAQTEASVRLVTTVRDTVVFCF